MSKITNDSLTRSGTGCFTAVPIRQQWSTKLNRLKGSDLLTKRRGVVRRVCRGKGKGGERKGPCGILRQGLGGLDAPVCDVF